MMGGGARGHGGRTNGLLDNGLLLESVKRGRVRQDPLQGAPRVATSPATDRNNQRRQDTTSTVAPAGTGAVKCTQCKAALLSPADVLLRVLRVQVRDQIVVEDCNRKCQTGRSSVCSAAQELELSLRVRAASAGNTLPEPPSLGQQRHSPSGKPPPGGHGSRARRDAPMLSLSSFPRDSSFLIERSMASMEKTRAVVDRTIICAHRQRSERRQQVSERRKITEG